MEKEEATGKELYPSLGQKTPDAPLPNYEEEMGLLTKAADFAARRHRFQKRKDERTPYCNHPIGVAFLLTR